MPYDRAGYRNHCGECRYFKLDEERTKLRREVFGEHAPEVHYCGKLHIFVNVLDSPSNPSSNAAGCFSYEKGAAMAESECKDTYSVDDAHIKEEKANGIDNEPNPKEN